MRFPRFLTAALVAPFVFAAVAAAQEKEENGAAEKPAEQKPAAENSAAAPASQAADDAGLVRLSKEDAVWIHPQRKLVVIEGEVAFREGFLEMFACPKGTKEHESLIAVNTKAYVIHAALLAVGAEPGRPVQFNPEYRAAEGPVIDIHILWRDAGGKKQTIRAQEWVRNTETQKEMEQDWVFGGSGFWTDEETGTRHYYAEQGDLICLSNFATATLDVPVESSQANDALMFEAFTERVPPRGTPVRLVLIPRKTAATEKKPANR
jgi:ketosteroid isomerase-like protein